MAEAIAGTPKVVVTSSDSLVRNHWKAIAEGDTWLFVPPADLPLALGVDRVERQRRLARARKAGEHDEPVAGQFQRHVLEVVLPRAADHEPVGHRAQGTRQAG
jgi:hypothetical protein